MRTSGLLAVLIGGAVVAAGPAAAVTAALAPADEVRAVAETTRHRSGPTGPNDAADDPAIWVSATAPDDSVVIGTLKEGGLDAYDLTGARLQHVPAPDPGGPGRAGSDLNNVDVVQGVDVPGLPSDFAVVSDRGRDRLRTYAIDPSGAAAGKLLLTDVTDPDAPPVFSRDERAVEKGRNAYGLALRINDAGTVQAIATQRNATAVALLDLEPGAGGSVTYSHRDQIKLPSKFRLSDGTIWRPCTERGRPPKLEGLVVDRRTGALYAGQEEVGVWRVPLTDGAFGKPRLIERVTGYGIDAEWNEHAGECEVVGNDPGEGGEHIVAQVEGLSIAYVEEGMATLIVSSQGDNTFSTFELGVDGMGWTWSRTFEVIDSAQTDAVNDCDGLAIVTDPLGATFPHGVLVVQDGHDTGSVADLGGHRYVTNFKYVPWERVAS